MINLVWLTKKGSQTNFEQEYIIKRVFSAFDCNHFQINNLVHCNAIIIFSCNTESPCEDYWKVINWYQKSNLPYFLFHLSDERCVFNPTYYTGAKWVWRNYGHDKYNNVKNLSIVPLGFQSGFLNNDRKLNTQRTIDVTFAGSLKQDRLEMVKSITALDNNLVKVTEYFNDPAGIPINGMRDLYNQTFFAPCPIGWSHPDSFRIMESLEHGAIPVIQESFKSYFEKLYPMNPFLFVNNWDELNSFIQKLRPKMDVCLTNTFHWYSNYIQTLKNSVKQKYESLL